MQSYLTVSICVGLANFSPFFLRKRYHHRSLRAHLHRAGTASEARAAQLVKRSTGRRRSRGGEKRNERDRGGETCERRCLITRIPIRVCSRSSVCRCARAHLHPQRTRVNAVVGAAGGYGLAHQDVWRRRIMRAVQRRARNFVDSNCDELQLESALIESVSQ